MSAIAQPEGASQSRISQSVASAGGFMVALPPAGGLELWRGPVESRKWEVVRPSGDLELVRPAFEARMKEALKKAPKGQPRQGRNVRDVSLMGRLKSGAVVVDMRVEGKGGYVRVSVARLKPAEAEAMRRIWEAPADAWVAPEAPAEAPKSE
jgi:hypothetical protein